MLWAISFYHTSLVDSREISARGLGHGWLDWGPIRVPDSIFARLSVSELFLRISRIVSQEPSPVN